jgi:tRNA pseudouridine38-40 synthase
MPTQRYMLTIAYRGTHYHGWQFQAANPLTWKGPWPPESQGIPTVQEIVARHIGMVVGHPITLVGSSRTDAGVHAKGQIAHFDTDQAQIPPAGLRQAVNAQLPDDILIRLIEPMPRSFDAIASTLSKRYQYFIWNAPDRAPFFADLAWHRRHILDVDAMSAAAAELVGEHDFASFARPAHGRGTSIRTIFGCSVAKRGRRVVIGVEGSGFLWNMVRIIAGTLVDVGMGKFKPAEIPAMLAARDRRASGGTAPPHGLFLQWVRLREEGKYDDGGEGMEDGE